MAVSASAKTVSLSVGWSRGRRGLLSSNGIVSARGSQVFLEMARPIRLTFRRKNTKSGEGEREGEERFQRIISCFLLGRTHAEKKLPRLKQQLQASDLGQIPYFLFPYFPFD